MKNFKLLIFFLFGILALPLTVNAKEKSKINVYLFKGEGCGYCANALEFFESIENEYGKYFNLVEYEVWYNQENAELMDKVEDYLDTKITGVPFIIVGNDTYPGFIYEWGENITNSIIDEYNKEESNRIDIIKNILGEETKKTSNSKEIIIDDIVSIIRGKVNIIIDFFFNVID